jgi:hypothetical protein
MALAELRDAELPGRTLGMLEQVIEHARVSVIHAAEALAEIRDHRLYKHAGAATFDQYCKDRWGLSRSRAYQLVDFALVRRELPVENELEARRIAPALRANRTEVLAAFAGLSKDVGPRAAIKELARCRRSAPIDHGTHGGRRRADEIDPSVSGSVVVVLGLPIGSEPPTVRVAADQDAAVSVRDELVETRRYRKVVMSVCEVEGER